MATSSSFKKSSPGGALIAALLLVVITLLLTTGYVDTLTSENKTAKDNENSQLALYAADAGIQYALEYIRTNVTTTTTTTTSVISGYPTRVDATMFSSGNNNVMFVLQCCDAETCPTDTTVTSTCSFITCGADSCMKYIATGLVKSSSNTIAQRKIEAKISLKQENSNIFQWDEYYI